MHHHQVESSSVSLFLSLYFSLSSFPFTQPFSFSYSLTMLVALWLLCVVVAVSAAFAVMLWWTLTRRQPQALRPHTRGPMRVCVVLGSGGHTSEMLRSLETIPSSFWAGNRPFYVVSATDTHSRGLAQQFEQRHFQRHAETYVIPRAREVGQSYFTSIFTTLKATLAALSIVYRERPQVVLTNGPGVCVPVVVDAVLLAACFPWRFSRPAVVYLESFTCISHASLTGRLLAPWFTDVFTVHWRKLERVIASMKRRGRLYYIGAEGGGDGASAGTAASLPLLQERAATPKKDGEPYALVTVGSTHFDALIHAVAQPHVCVTLKERFGVTKLLLQYGTVDFALHLGDGDAAAATTEETDGVQRTVCNGVTVEAFAYRPHLGEWVRDAALVITHAGAGTILECLYARCPTVVVPNRLLMSDHQLELAEALAKEHYLFCLAADTLPEQLGGLDLNELRVYSGMNVAALTAALSGPLTGVVVEPAEEQQKKKER